jgi:hypothetical protein
MMSTTENRHDGAPHQLQLTSWIQDSAVSGRRVECEWLLVNRSSEDALVGFYLHVYPGSISDLACTAGVARCGRFHGSASVAIPAGQFATVSAGWQAQGAGDHAVRVVAVTRNEMIARTHTVGVVGAGARRAGTLPFSVRLWSLARWLVGATPT